MRRGRGFLDEERGALTTKGVFRSVTRVIGNFTTRAILGPVVMVISGMN